jgi:hypothetical protein
MSKQVLIIGSILITLCSCKYEKNDGPEQVKLVGPGIISSEYPEFATSISSDGKELYFNRTTADRSSMFIMVSKLVEGEWSTPDTLDQMDGKYRDVDPFITDDGNRLYFSSTRPVVGSDSIKDFDTWYVGRNEEGWSQPINAGYPLNSAATEIFVSMTAEGHAYFVSERTGQRTIMRSQFTNNYQKPERLELQLNGEAIYAGNPCIASDESFLIVALRAPHKPNVPDLYITFKTETGWSTLVSLGPEVNSMYADFAPGLSKDDRILYFTSERPGMVPKQEEGIRPPGDIYAIKLKPLINRLKKTVGD